MKGASLFIALILSALSLSVSAATFQMKLDYSLSPNGSEYGSVYVDVSGYTPSALQAALTTTFTVTSLNNYTCINSTAGSTVIEYNKQMYVGNYCYFKFPNETTFRYVKLIAIATGSMSGNVLNGTSGTASTEVPFDTVFASSVFAFFFSFIVGVWYFCKNLGLIINAVRRW